MILKTYLWRQPGDGDYIAPTIKMIDKDLLSSYTGKTKKIIEAVSLKNKTILVQFRDTEDQQIKLLEIYYKQNPQLLPLPDSNQKFDS